MTKSADDVKRELEKNKKKGKGGKHSWFKLKEDVTAYLRVGPPWEKDGEIWKEVLTHGGYKEKVYCRQNDKHPETGKPRKCAVCIRLAELKSDRSNYGKKLWSLIKQRSESLWNILVAKKYKKKEDGRIIVRVYDQNKFQIFRLSTKWHNNLLEIFADEDYRRKSILGITHSKYGRLVKASRTRSGRDDTNYTFRCVDHETPIFPDQDDRKKILKTLINLDELVHASSKEEIDTFLARMEKKARILAKEDKKHGRDEEDDEDEDVDDEEDDDRPKKKKKHRRDEEDEDDDDTEDSDEDGDSDDEDGDEDDDDDLERKYKKAKKKLKKKKAKHDDEDEDEDEEDENDEEDDE